MVTYALLIFLALLVLNLLSFGLMAYDKRCAKAGKRRIPEKTLFLSTACFGGLGGVLGMRICRHKTKHRSFQIFFPLILILQILLLLLLLLHLLRVF